MNFTLGLEPKADVEILVDGGPLVVAPAWNLRENRRIPGLFWIYFRKHGLRFGPYYASIALAEKDMRKTLKHFPKGFWDEPYAWYTRQPAFRDWVEKNLGKGDDLVGGRWASD